MCRPDPSAFLLPIKFINSQKRLEQNGLKFVTFCKGKRYEDNLLASEIAQLDSLSDIRDQRLVYDEPGGPARILYLNDGNVGFILSNGEKIGEWMGWLAWVAHSSGRLRAYEISFESSWTREEILMAPGQAYSILGNNVFRDRGRKHKSVQLNLVKLGFLKNPSQYRSTLLVCPSLNEKIRSTLISGKCTELRFDHRSSTPV